MIPNKSNVTALAKCWRSKSGLLVADGDESAIALFARAGQIVARKDAEKFENASEFFGGIERPAAAPEPEEETEPKPRKRGDK